MFLNQKNHNTMNKKIKVCHLTSVHSTFDVRIFHKECKSLAEAGYDVSLVVANGGEDQEVDGVKVYDVGRPAGRRERMFKYARKVYEKGLELDCDIYHFHDPELIPYGLRLLRHGKKVVYDIHENLPKQVLYKEYIPLLIRRLISFSVNKWESRAIRKFSYNIVADPDTYDRVSRLTKKAEMVRNFVILDDVPIDWQSKEDAMTYIGSITEPRGIFDMLEILKHVDIKLVLAGKFSNKELEAKAKSMPGWEKVEYLGFVGKDQVLRILQRVKIGLVPLHKTEKYLGAYPVKLFEYMNAGIPVIINKIPLWEEIVLGENCGLSVDTTDPQEFAKAIQFFLDNPDKAREMGMNGYRAVREKYNWNIEKQKLLQVYENLSQDL